MTRKTAIALALLALLAAVVPLLIILKPEGPVIGTLAFIAMVGLFRLMGRFENIGGANPERTESPGRADHVRDDAFASTKKDGASSA